MDAVSFGFLLACVAVLLLTALTVKTDPHAHRFIAALLLFFSWAFSKLVAAYFGWEFARALAPMTDCLGGVLVANLYVKSPVAWKSALVWIFATKLAIHMGYRLGIALGANPWFIYQLTENALYALELLCVAFPGGSVGAAVALDWIADALAAPGRVAVRLPGGHRSLPAARRQDQVPPRTP